MSFERTLRTASNAATKEIKTKFEGLSERIIVNKLIKHGSGFCDVIKAPPECGHENCWNIYHGKTKDEMPRDVSIWICSKEYIGNKELQSK